MGFNEADVVRLARPKGKKCCCQSTPPKLFKEEFENVFNVLQQYQENFLILQEY
jgi:hypothetical protein